MVLSSWASQIRLRDQVPRVGPVTVGGFPWDFENQLLWDGSLGLETTPHLLPFA